MRTPLTLRILQSTPRAGWIALAVFVAIAWIAVPVAHAVLPESHPLHLSAYTVSLLGKILCYMVVVLGGVGQLTGTVVAALGLGVLNKLLEGWAGAVLAKIMVLALIVVFIQKRPQGLFAFKGRSEA